MAKRFTDTDKYKKKFIRGLPGAYKLFWDYLYHECNHAGIWHVDFEVAQIYIGNDMLINKEKSLELFNQNEMRIIETKDKSKWFIIPFVEFQYGKLNPNNKCHASVISVLEKEGIDYENKGFASPLQGAKDKDKDKDKDNKSLIINKQEVIELNINGILSNFDNAFEHIWSKYPNKDGRKQAYNHFKSSIKSQEDFDNILKALDNYLKSDKVVKGFVKDGKTWFNNWQDWINPSDYQLKGGLNANKSGFSSVFRQGYKGDNTAGTVSSKKFDDAGIAS